MATVPVSSSAVGAGLPDFKDVRGGLIVHVGTTDGKLEIALARGGRRLVHGLAVDATSARAAREAIAAGGLYGLASVEVAGDLTKLPYADNMVNLLISEVDLGRGEVLRALAPNGSAYLRNGSGWTVLKKPRPAAMDEWTHFDYGPDGNALSGDTLVAPPKQVQWISGIQEAWGESGGILGFLRRAPGRREDVFGLDHRRADKAEVRGMGRSIPHRPKSGDRPIASLPTIRNSAIVRLRVKAGANYETYNYLVYGRDFGACLLHIVVECSRSSAGPARRPMGDSCH